MSGAFRFFDNAGAVFSCFWPCEQCFQVLAYELRIDVAEDGAEAAALTTTELQAEVAGLQGGTAYRVRVRASNAAGEGEWSADLAVTTAPAEVPQADYRACAVPI